MYSQKISVITINYNNCKGLQRTLRSVLSQTYPILEYIVIDGGSTDGSVEEIRKLESNIDYWVSESDKGIYHAMNKGIRKATGDYCLFLNSGDSLHDVNTLSEFSACLMPNDDLLMGRIVCIPSGHTGKRTLPRHSSYAPRSTPGYKKQYSRSTPSGLSRFPPYSWNNRHRSSKRVERNSAGQWNNPLPTRWKCPIP